MTNKLKQYYILKFSYHELQKETYKVIANFMRRTKMKKKDLVIITRGKNIGKYGKIIEIEERKGKKRRNALVTIEDERKNHYQTVLDFVFAIGETKPLISLPEAPQVV